MTEKKNKILLELNGAGIARSGKWLVKDVSFSLSEGEILTIIGPNGSGKSTTAKMALGILKPDKGNITLHNTANGAKMKTLSKHNG